MPGRLKVPGKDESMTMSASAHMASAIERSASSLRLRRIHCAPSWRASKNNGRPWLSTNMVRDHPRAARYAVRRPLLTRGAQQVWTRADRVRN
ncbi:hypothetical protein X997_5846 [Burkholderia pseudomallei A79C]|nr:hypothetical protein X997_5846 [Burkholderia pseudomallei A79C]